MIWNRFYRTPVCSPPVPAPPRVSSRDGARYPNAELSAFSSALSQSLQLDQQQFQPMTHWSKSSICVDARLCAFTTTTTTNTLICSRTNKKENCRSLLFLIVVIFTLQFLNVFLIMNFLNLSFVKLALFVQKMKCTKNWY